MTDKDRLVAALAAQLRVARRMLIFTGAGISTGSGIPDYRGPQGVWKTKQPVYYADFMGSEAARVRHWSMRVEGADLFGAALPNAVHLAIRRLELADKIACVVTQNVDGLHAAAGTSAGRLVEIHGTTQKAECQSCGWIDDIKAHLDFFRTRDTAPRCDCGGYLKSATISFGQPLKRHEIVRAEQAASECDLVVALGSTLSVHPANMIPLMAAERAVPYVIINQGVTDHDGLPPVSLRLEGDVTILFPAAVEAALA
jgi:NAD-dependent deacetylase